MVITEARAILGFDGELIESVLKSHYRSFVRSKHTDLGGEGGDFALFKEAYDCLLGYIKAISLGPDKNIDPLTTMSGKPLSDYGKGLPLNVNAKPCNNCHGDGVVKVPLRGMIKEVPCGKCNGHGIVNYPCKFCEGTGNYCVNGKVVGQCNKCVGTGRFFPIKKYPYKQSRLNYSPWGNVGISCDMCNGDGTVDRTIYDGYGYVVCGDCGGIGEVRLYNAVLPRGFLAGKIG